MDIQRAIHILQDCGDAAKGTEFEQVFRMGAAALQEQAEREKGCEFCKTFDFSEASTSVDGGYAHIHLAGGSYRFPKDKQFKFCPMCGRRLK